MLRVFRSQNRYPLLRNMPTDSERDYASFSAALKMSSPVPPLMRCLRIADGLNPFTRRGEIGTSLPVFGLRPIRCPFLRTTKEPNDDSFTVSPFSRQSVISFKTSSTNADDSVRERPTFW